MSKKAVDVCDNDENFKNKQIQTFYVVKIMSKEIYKIKLYLP